MSEEEAEADAPWCRYEVRCAVDKRIRIDGPDGLRMYLDCDIGGEEFAKRVEAADEIVRLLNDGWQR